MKFKDIFSYFLLFTTAFLFSTNIAPAIIFNEHTISDDYPGAHFVYAVDMDGDDDIDVLGTAYNADVISWWENDGEQEFDEHIIADNFDGPRSVDPVDMDGDGDMDVLGTAYVAPGYIAWWENDGDEGFTQHTISSNFDGAFSAMAVDIDGDDDVDVIAAARVANRLSWFANDGNQNFTEYAVSANFDGAISVYAADVDDDGDMDVLGAAQDADDITWWEQFDAGRPAFNENNISGNFNGAMSVYAEDIDGDDDIDVLGSGYEGNQVGWWENDGDQEFTENIIMRNFNIGYRVLATDVDGDGDMDILGCAKEADKVSWFENDGNQEFDEHIIVSNYDGATGLHFADVDDDGDMDILSTAVYGNELTWWENDSPPAPFDLYEPINDSLLSEQPVILRWYGTYDPDRDPEDAVTYYVEIGLDEDYNDSELYEAGEDTFYNFDDVVDDLDYWWRVFAEDVNEGNIRISNQSWHISTSFPPTEFDLATPDSGSIHTDDAIELSWEVSEDPGDGNILYDLYISDDPGNFEEPFELNLGENSYDFRPPNELDYYWTVHARDM
ncbi:MAG: VCBS repeat-containing protein, partial [Candidatus Electryonea clarkiae]|nr:VCBS repeat-containing protein [Candidatus Electryonea clarkiae]